MDHYKEGVRMANAVYVDKLAVTMRLRNKGVTLRVEDDDGKLRGYLRVSKAYVRWYRGKEQKPCYKKHIDAFIAQAEDTE
jgi:hypothetical protein